MVHHRDSMFIGPPPENMENPIGMWYWGECDCLAAECTAKTYHVWKVKWMENRDNG